MVTAAATLAAAVAVSTVTWLLVSATLLHPFPIVELERWTVVEAQAGSRLPQRAFVYPLLPAIEDAGLFDRVVATWTPLERLVTTMREGASRAHAAFVTGNHFAAFGLHLQAGRDFTADDDRQGAPPVAILSDRFWRHALGADPRVIGRTVAIGRGHAVIVGIAPVGFRGLDLADAPDVYLPLSVIAAVADPLTNYFADPGHVSSPTAGLRILGRLRERQSAAATADRLAQLGSSQWGLDRNTLRLRPLAMTVLEGNTRDDLVTFERMLAGTVALMLLLGAAAVAFSLLMGVETRHREFATCLALGASSRSLLLGSVVESALICSAAVALALPTAAGVLSILRASHLPGAVSIELLGIDIDHHAWLTAFAIGILLFLVIAAVVSGYAYRRLSSLTMGDLTSSMRRSPRYRECAALLAVEVTIAVVLLVGAGLFVKSLESAFALNAAAVSQEVLSADIDLPLPAYTPLRAGAFFDEWRRRMSAAPAVARVAYSVNAGGMTPLGRLKVNGVPRAFPTIVRFRAIDDGYFRTVGLPIVAGRPFGSDERSGGPEVGIASASLARLLGGPEAALGQTLGLPGSSEHGVTIVGVVPDLVVDVAVLQPLTLYLPLAQLAAVTYATVSVRAAGDVDAARRAVVATARSIDPAVPLPQLLTVRDGIERQMAAQRLASTVLGTLGVVAVLLTALGTYVLADSLATVRTREIGVRVAVGATPTRIVGLVLSSAARPLGCGLAAGLAVAWAGSGALRALLFQVRPADPVTIGATAIAVGLAVFVASLGPAVRASRSDVSSVLRQL